MSGEPGLVYWDTNIFLALFKNEDRPNNEMAGVHYFKNRIDQKKVRLITSTITRVEVLDAGFEEAQRRAFAGFFNSQRVRVVAPDLRIAEEASRIRTYYLKRSAESSSSRKMTTPDAIHLATAILFEADQFHTFDKRGKKGSISLLELGDRVAGKRLDVCMPTVPESEPGQGTLLHLIE